MTRQQHQPTATATTDALGRCTFTFPPVAAQNLAVQGTVAVNGGQAGTFTAHDSTGLKWGTWSGSQPYGPITLQANITLELDATGLSPNTPYQAQFLGVADLVENLDASMPTALGASSLVGTDAIVNLPTAEVVAGGAVLLPELKFFPCINFAALRLAAVLASGGPVTIECVWWNADTSAQMGYRLFVVGASATMLQVVVPHLGDQLEIRATNNAPLNPPAADSSGNGNDAAYQEIGSGPPLQRVTLDVPGIVGTDTMIQIGPEALAAAVTRSGALAPAGFTAADMSLVGWVDMPTAAALPAGTLDVALGVSPSLGGALAFALSFQVDNSGGGFRLRATRNFGGPGFFETVDSDASPIAIPGAHMFAVRYNATTRAYRFYVDGAPFGADKVGVVGATSPDSGLFLAQGLPGNVYGFDELALFPALLTDANVAALYAARGDFATYSATCLALTPTAYYHLDEVPTAPAAFSLCATHTTQPLAMFGGLDIDNAITTTIPGDGLPHVILAPPFVFGGPAEFSWNPGGLAAAFVVEVQAQQGDGTWNTFYKRTNADTPPHDVIALYMPAAPIRVVVTNNTGADHNADAALMYDLHRVG